MKKSTRVFAIVLTLLMCLVGVLLTACNDNNNNNNDNDDNKNNNNNNQTTYYTVTFNTNGGSTVAAQKVAKDGKATLPTDPTKDGFIFGGWCTDEALQNVFDFNTAITADITLYAAWDSATNVTTAKFYWNYDGAPDNGVFATKTFADGSRIADPGTPARQGYYFGGWYTEDGSESYSAMKKYTGNQEFFAKWQQIYVFEAEKTQLTGLTDDIDKGLATEGGAKLGFNFSGSANGTQLIKSDSAASGGQYVTGLFYRGAYLQFEINSDKAVSGATLRLVLSVEYADISLTSDTYKVEVNGTKLKYNDFTLGNGTATSTDPGPRGGFKEIYIGNIDLVAGKNVIKLTVNNSQTPAGDAGTVDAASPAVDCIKIYTDAALTMTTYDNK